MSDTVSARNAEKRRRMLDAARVLLLAQGLRGTTMEAIARSANVAKPTLYNYFSDKDAVLEALIEELIAEKTRIFLAALESDAPLAERVGAAMADMFGQVGDMLEGSPHAAELISQPHRFSHKLEKADADVLVELTKTLEAEGIDRPRDVAKILFAAGTGILNKFPGGAAVRDACMVLCQRMLGTPKR